MVDGRYFLFAHCAVLDCALACDGWRSVLLYVADPQVSCPPSSRPFSQMFLEVKTFIRCNAMEVCLQAFIPRCFASKAHLFASRNGS